MKISRVSGKTNKKTKFRDNFLDFLVFYYYYFRNLGIEFSINFKSKEWILKNLNDISI